MGTWVCEVMVCEGMAWSQSWLCEGMGGGMCGDTVGTCEGMGWGRDWGQLRATALWEDGVGTCEGAEWGHGSVGGCVGQSEAMAL